MALNEHDAGGASGGAEHDPRLDRLYREAARDAPPAHLDAAILAAARREAGVRPRPVSSTLRRWHVPVSIAAVVMVSVSLVVLVREEGGDQLVQAPPSTVAIPSKQPAAPAAQPAPDTEARDAAQPRLAAPAPQRQESRDDARFSAALGKREDSARTESGSPASSGVAAVATPAPAAKPSPQPFVAAPPRVAEIRAAPAPADAVTAGRLASAPAASGEPLAAPPVADAQRARPTARAMAEKAAELDRQPVWHGYEKELPQKWLERIEELKRQGRTAEAEDMLSEFKRRFPEYPLPPGSK